MGENEFIENNGFENFEDQGKYKSVTLKKTKRANQIAKVSVVLLLMGIGLSDVGLEWQKEIAFMTSIGYGVKWSDIIVGVHYVCAAIFSAIAFVVQRTKLTKGMFTFFVLFPLSLILSAFAGFLLLYIIAWPLVHLAWSSM